MLPHAHNVRDRAIGPCNDVDSQPVEGSSFLRWRIHVLGIEMVFVVHIGRSLLAGGVSLVTSVGTSRQSMWERRGNMRSGSFTSVYRMIPLGPP